jgi:hypothetical protein
MSVNAASSSPVITTARLPGDVSPSSPTVAGEVEIAGRHYVTAERLASVLGVTVRTLARWNACRIGPPKIKIGKTILFDLAKVPDWLGAREIPATRETRSR